MLCKWAGLSDWPYWAKYTYSIIESIHINGFSGMENFFWTKNLKNLFTFLCFSVSTSSQWIQYCFIWMIIILMDRTGRYIYHLTALMHGKAKVIPI